MLQTKKDFQAYTLKCFFQNDELILIQISYLILAPLNNLFEIDIGDLIFFIPYYDLILVGNDALELTIALVIG